MKSLKQIICTLYLAVLFVVYPLFQHDHYYNMGENKYYFYLVSTIIFLVLLVIAIITDEDAYKKSKSKKKRKSANASKNAKSTNAAKSAQNSKNTKTTDSTKAKAELTSGKLSFKERLIRIKDIFMAWFGPKSIVEKFVWAYLVAAIISFIFGIDKYYGFWGADGWHMGLLIQCLMIACFFAFAKVWEPSMLPVYFSMIGSGIVMLLGILMRFGFDPLHNYEGLDQYYINMFVSTIGQTSWYSAYVATVFPIGVALFFVSENSKTRIASTIYTVVAFLAIAIADSDSIFLGIGGMLMVLFWVAFTEEKYMVRLFQITTMLTGAYVVMEEMKVTLHDYYTGEQEFNSIKSTNIKLYTAAFAASLAILIILAIFSKKGVLARIYEYRKPLKILRGSVYVIAILGVIGVITYIVLNTKGVFGVTEDMVPYYGNFLYFNDAWGNTRGVSWKVCWKLFCDYSIGRKLVGVGPDSLAVATQYVDEYRNMLATIFGEDQVLTCAHNEFYNHLVVYGILGGVTYAGIYVSGIIRYIKSFAKKPIVVAAAAAIAAYAGHNSFCYQTVICTPLILVIIGVAEAALKEGE